MLIRAGICATQLCHRIGKPAPFFSRQIRRCLVVASCLLVFGLTLGLGWVALVTMLGQGGHSGHAALCGSGSRFVTRSSRRQDSGMASETPVVLGMSLHLSSPEAV